MNLKLIDRVIESYKPELGEDDINRLEFFRGLWGEMERWSDSPSAPSKKYQIPSDELLEAAWEDDRPAFSLVAPKLSQERTVAIAGSLRAYLIDSGMLTEEDARGLKEIDFSSLLNAGGLAKAANDPEQFLNVVFTQAVDELGASKNVARYATMVVMLALRVDFEPIAKAIKKAQLKNKNPLIVHNPLVCPVCGCDPALARVGGADSPSEGRGRTLYCAQCGNDWEYERIRCARCGTKNQGHLHFYHIDGDDTHRIATCDECGSYIRTVYIDEPLHPFSYEVEEVLTAKLDAVARDPKFLAKED